MDDAAVSEWRESFFVSANGVPYSESHRVSAMNAMLTHGGSVRASARDARCSPSTLCRYVKRYAREGSFSARKHTGGQASSLSAEDAHFLHMFYLAFPTTYLYEAQAAVELFRGVTVSVSTVWRELDRLGLTRKAMKYYSTERREWSRVLWWTALPGAVDAAGNAVAMDRRGLRGVHHGALVCMDEAVW